MHAQCKAFESEHVSLHEMPVLVLDQFWTADHSSITSLSHLIEKWRGDLVAHEFH